MKYTGPDISIIYEDDMLFAVNKPAGLVVHSDGRTEEATLTDWVLEKYPACAEIGGLHTLDNGRYVPRAGIVHRLDRETSGVVLIAKTDEAFWPLQQQFIDRTTSKKYLAICLGKPAKSSGTIDLSIGRSRTDYREWATPPNARGTLRSAITDYSLLGTGEYEGKEYSLVGFSPKTGRTHQLRVHAKAAGFPIVCDIRYHTQAALGMERLALHASSLTVKHPNGRVIEFTAPLPGDIKNAVDLLKIQ
jgi:23S rRNA pseudouridine1911/1915/1917 synthase